MTIWMFASALIQGFLLPPGMLVTGLVLAALAAWSGRSRLVVVVLAVPALITAVLSVPVVADGLAGVLERQALAEGRKARALPLPRTAVVLGGGVGPRWLELGDRSGGEDYRLPGDGKRAAYDLGMASDRVVAGMALLRGGAVDRLVLAGGASHGVSEAELMARFLVDLGVDRRDLLLEDASRTTRENARNVAQTLKTAGLGPDVTLITSAYHLPRALLEFRCAGLVPVGLPAETEALDVRREPPLDWIPRSESLDLSRRVLKEWLGTLAARQC